MAINFSASKEDAETISKIADRAIKLYKEVHGEDLEKLDMVMDITACHMNGCPLKLQALLAAGEFDFAHDVFGISNHIDRKTGKLTRCFLPRFSA